MAVAALANDTGIQTALYNDLGATWVAYKGGGDNTSSAADDAFDTALETAGAYFESLTEDNFDIASVILGETFVADAIAKGAVQDLVTLQLLIEDAIRGDVQSGFAEPTIQFAPNGDILSATEQTVLPDGVQGAFVPGKNGGGGAILVSEALQNDQATLENVVLEELGEALGAFAAENGFEPVDGDVGNRLMRVFNGEAVEDIDFSENASGPDESDVKFEGEIVAAKTSSASTNDITAPNNWEIWGYSEADYNDALADAQDLIDYFGSDPWPGLDIEYYKYSDLNFPGMTGEEKQLFGALYGIPAPGIRYLGDNVSGQGTDESGEYLSVEEIARALLDGVINPGATADGTAGVTANFQNVAVDTIVDAVFTYVINRNYGGNNRRRISIEDLDQAYRDVLRNDGAILDTDYDFLMNKFGDMMSSNGDELQFSRRAVANIFNSGYHQVSDEIILNAGDPYIDIIVDRNSSTNSWTSDEAHGFAMELTPVWTNLSSESKAGDVIGELAFKDEDDFVDGFEFWEQSVNGAQSQILDVNDAGEIVLTVDYADIENPAEVWYSVQDFSNNHVQSSISLDALAGGGDPDTGEFEWMTFGYYDDTDEDGIVDGDDPDFSDSFTVGTIPAAANIPADAIITNIVDLKAGSTDDFANDVRVITYEEVDTGNIITKSINMSADSAEFGEPIAGFVAPKNGGLNFYMDDGLVHSLSDSDIDTLNDVFDDHTTDQDQRRLSGEDADKVIELKNELRSSGVNDADFLDSGQAGAIAYVRFTDGTGQTRIRFRYDEVTQLHTVGSDDLFVNIHHGEAIEGTEAYNKVQAALDNIEKANSSSSFRYAAVGGLATGILEGGTIIGTGLAAGAVAFAGLEVAAVATVIAGVGMATSMRQAARAKRRMNEALGSDSIILQPSEMYNATDPGLVGTGFSAYWIPEDAELIGDPEFLAASETTYGVDVMEYTYTLPQNADTYYKVAVNVDDPNGEDYGLVEFATKTILLMPDPNGDYTDGLGPIEVTSYDASGAEILDDVPVEASDYTSDFNVAELVGDYDEQVAHIQTLLPPNAVAGEIESVGALTRMEFTSSDFTGTKVIMTERTLNAAGEAEYEVKTDWLSSTAVKAFDAGYALMSAVFGEMMESVGYAGQRITSAAVNQLVNYLVRVSMPGVATDMGFDSQALTAPQYAAVATTTALMSGLPYLAGQAAEAAFSSAWSYALSRSENLVDAGLGNDAVIMPDTDLGPADTNPPPVAQADGPPDTVVPTFSSQANLFLNDLAAASDNVYVSQTGSTLQDDRIVGVPISDAAYEQLGSILENSETESILRGQFDRVNLLSDPVISQKITDYGNAVYKAAGGDPNFELTPRAFEIRKQTKSSTAPNNLHQDRTPYGITMTLALKDATATQWVSQANEAYVQKVGNTNAWQLSQTAIDAGLTVDDVVTTGNSRDLNILTGTNSFDAFNGIVHRAPPDEIGRELLLLRFNKVAKRDSGQAT